MLSAFLAPDGSVFKLLMEQNAVLQRMAQKPLIVVMENTYESEGHLKQINILKKRPDKLTGK